MMKRYTARLAMALGFVGAVALAGVAFAQGGMGALGDDLEPAAFGRGHPGPHHGRMGALVTAEGTFETEDGLITRRMDAGEVTGTDGDTVRFERADGETLSITAGEDTLVRRDREEAEVSDLQAGDRVHVLQVDAGDGFVVRAIMAISPEALEEREARMQEGGDRRARLRERIERFRERFGSDADDAEETSASI